MEKQEYFAVKYKNKQEICIRSISHALHIVNIFEFAHAVAFRLPAIWRLVSIVRLILNFSYFYYSILLITNYKLNKKSSFLIFIIYFNFSNSKIVIYYTKYYPNYLVNLKNEIDDRQKNEFVMLPIWLAIISSTDEKNVIKKS